MKPIKLPQRKPNKSMSGKEMMNKLVYGTPKPPTDKQRREADWNKVINKAKVSEKK